MSLKSLYDDGITIYRILAARDDTVLVIDCIKRSMPKWLARDKLADFQIVEEKVLYDKTGVCLATEESLSRNAVALAHKRYSMIAPAVAVVADKKRRSEMIAFAALNSHVTKQTVRKYLCLYLVYQTVTALAPIDVVRYNELAEEQKLMRWALNKYFYTSRENSLRTAYLYLLKEKYLDNNGVLKEDHPSFYQFRYFYRKTRNEQNYLISRKGLTDYQRNYRPLLGEGVSEFAPNIGVAMLDSTVCDIYLVDDVGNLMGRPILTACVDAYTQLCYGFALTWQGGMVSLRELMNNVIIDKVEYCKKYGIIIDRDDWNCKQLPGVMVTDRGMEYCSENFEQLSELGATIINLPSYRPELKGIIEKFFDLIQCYFKPYLKGRGVIEPDYLQRGAHDYRLDACLTLEDFKKVLLRCIVHYNSHRKIGTLNYTQDMIDCGVKPVPCELWNYCKAQPGANLITVNQETLRMTMLPRSTGAFSRKGLIVNRLRYKQEGFMERFLKGGSCVVAYDPDNVGCVWLLENGNYTRFDLIESRFRNKSLSEVETLQERIKELKNCDEDQIIQEKIDLSRHITAIGDTAKHIQHSAVKVSDSV